MSVLIGALLVTAIVSAAWGDGRHREELKEHYDHLAYNAEYDCHRPQPRVLTVDELISEEATAHKAFFPDVTVLHRCDDHAGCCPPDQHCTPEKTDSVLLPFKVTFLKDLGSHKKGTWAMEYHKLANHTTCACVEPPVVEEPKECVHLRQHCESITASCSKLQASCPRVAWSPTTEHTPPAPDTTTASHLECTTG